MSKDLQIIKEVKNKFWYKNKSALLKDLQTFCRCKVSRFTYNNKDSQIIKELRSRFGEFEYEVYNNKVTCLGLKSKKVKNKDLKLIGELTSLKDLYLNNNQITKIQGLNNLVELEYLNLKNNQITKIQGLEKSTKLRWLSLEGNNIDTIQGLDNLRNLKDIDFFDTNIPKKEIEQFKINNPEIFVYYNSELTLALLDFIKQNKQK